MPLTEYLTYLLAKPRTRSEAGSEARRLGIRLDWAEHYWRTIG
jgi:hypothetical protein